MTINPTPCHVPDEPIGVPLLTLEQIGTFMQLSVVEWKLLVKHEADWHAVHDKAKRCEVKP